MGRDADDVVVERYIHDSWNLARGKSFEYLRPGKEVFRLILRHG